MIRVTMISSVVPVLEYDFNLKFVVFALIVRKPNEHDLSSQV